MTIRMKMILLLLACTIIPMCFVGILGYYHAKKTLESLRIEELKSIADLKAKRIEDFFAEHQKHIAIAQQRPTIIKHTALLAEVSDDFSNPIYADIIAELDRALKMYRPVYKFLNVILANPQGKIVYALNRFSTPDRFESSLSDFWEESFHGDKTRIIYSKVFNNPAAAGKFSIFLMGPIRSLEGQLIGFTVFEIDMAPIYELIQDTTGLGETGETLIAKKDGDQALFLNPLRHDPDAALKRNIGLGERQAIPVQKALKGGSGSGISIDYRGQEVIAAWRYLPLLDWAMVAKIDLAEAFKPVAALRDFVLILAIAVMVLSIGVAFIVAKSISEPILNLQAGVEEVGKGNLDHRVATDAKDEIGQLGRAFDQMTVQLKAVTASRDELDKEIKERKKTEKELQKIMSEVDERIKELNCFFGISRLVERRGLNLEEILQGIVDLIPPAWQYPENTCANINLKDQEFRTGNFKETQWGLTQSIVVNDKAVGTLVVYYLEERPESDEGPFLKEERNLINSIAERIGRIIERNRAQNALVESEERFRELVEHSLTGISIIQDNQIVYQNPEQERLLGALPRPIKFADTDSIHPDDFNKVNAFYQKISTGNLPFGAMDFRFYPPGEKVGRSNLKWVQCQASRIEYLGKDAILVNMMDMTKAKELEHLLTIQDKMASLGRVAAGIAHEIRNPLSGINIYLNTLKKLHHKAGSEEKVEQILQHVNSASHKIESVIRRVMDFAKPSEPKLTLIDINQPITDAVNLTAVTMRKSGVNLQKQLADDLPPTYADSNLIEEMVLNLLNNAAEAMKSMEEGKKIIVTTSEDSDRIIVRVSDSGPGVPSEIRDKIFDPYFTTRPEGTGIGLSLSHRIITDHGGSLTVADSDLGGAEFRIEIPIKQ
ncbi:MAG: cache domain-containing protein [Desulfobacterales bacterium]|jgi:PAS domain S-box-containing protein